MEYENSIKYHKVFEDSTTYRNDYRKYVNIEQEIKLLKPKETEERIKPSKPFVFHDFESLHSMKVDACIPFNLFWEKSPIVGSDPRTLQTPKLELVDTGKEDAIKTRPRLYMSPAVSIDDVPDPKMRELLCKYMYTTEWRKAEREAVGSFAAKVEPPYVLEADNKVSFVREEHEPPPPGWREKGVEWDKKQNRRLVDPTREFWLQQDVIPRCEDVVDPSKKHISQEVKEHIATLLRKDELRRPHDLYHSSYTGYKPINAYGVSLDKVHFPVTHPLLSVAQAQAVRCAEPDRPLSKPEMSTIKP